MLSYDFRDFTRSAWSLAGGMLAVVVFAGFRTKGDLSTILLTLGLPFGVILFWALYAFKMHRFSQLMKFHRHENASDDIDEQHFLQFRATMTTGVEQQIQPQQKEQTPTLPSQRPLPRFKNRAKMPHPPSESGDAINSNDQWHQ